MAKQYKLKFTKDDFVNKSDNLWRTDVIDLYNNDQYVNYSSLKSPYGTDLLGNGVYTGLNSSDNINSEIGFVDNDRFVDTSGIVDILNWKPVFASGSIIAQTNVVLNTYLTDDEGLEPYYSHATPSIVNDWETILAVSPGSSIYSLSSSRYTFFEVEFQSDINIDDNTDFELIVMVQISGPVINGFFPGTRRALDRFPEWMEMREYDPEDLSSSNKATPDKIGGQFINAIAGEWLTDIRGQVTYNQFNQFIENVDLGQKAWVWHVSNLPTDVFSVTYVDNGLDVQLTNTTGVGEFYRLNDDQDAYFYNPIKAELFTLQEYPDGEFKINGQVFTQEPYHVWNSLDDIGVSVDLFRLHRESNDSFQKRILDVYISKPGVSADRFKLSLRRELNLWKHFGGATPDSFFLGATPEVLDIGDIENSEFYFDDRGNAKESFYNLIDDLSREQPMTWGMFEYGKALWDTDGLQKKGFATIPKQFDVSNVSNAYYQSGVGDGNDLALLPPDFYKKEQDFEFNISVRGRRPVTFNKYSEIQIETNIKAYSNRTTVEYEALENNFVIEINHTDTNTYITNVDISAAYYLTNPGEADLQDYSPTTSWPPPVPDDGAFSLFEWYSDDGFTAGFLEWYNKSTGELSPDLKIGLSEITNVKVRPGEFSPDSQLITNVPDEDYYQLKFEDDSLATGLGWAGLTFIENASPNFNTQDMRLQYQAWKFSVIENDVRGFESTSQVVEVKINEGNVLNSFVKEIGNFNFPTYNASGVETHIIEITMNERDENNIFGAFTESGVFIPLEDIYVNGSNAWSEGVLEIELGSTLAAGDTVELTFSCTSSDNYPVEGIVWENISAVQNNPLSTQYVNEYGPYRYGIAPLAGNSSNHLTTFKFDRSDFGLNETDIVTWIGVESVSNPEVLLWVETNAIVPYGESSSAYPENALTEFLEGGNKKLSPLKVYAKLKESTNPMWNPFLHSGWFYEDGEKYYVYANAEAATVGSGNEYIFNEGPFLGAPVIANTQSGTPIRHVPYSGESGIITEISPGTGSEFLYSAYEDIFDVSVYDTTLQETVSLASTSFSSNAIETLASTLKNHIYEISYKTNFSFSLVPSATPGKSEMKFSVSADDFGPFIIHYEASKYNPATPIDIALHPAYDGYGEGFIYIDHDEQDLAYIEAWLSNPVLLATPGNHSMVTVMTFDINGNPKPNVTLSLSASSDVEIPASIETDTDGIGIFYIESSITADSGTLTLENIGSAISENIDYRISTVSFTANKLQAVMDTEEVLADGESGTTLFGRLLDPNDQPIANETISWRKARDLYTLFSQIAISSNTATPGSDLNAGEVETDIDGRFSIGPFVSQTEPGYWLVSTEGAGTGDVTYWYEYLDVTNILDPTSLQPIYSIQSATPSYLYDDFFATPVFPVTFDIEDYTATPTSATPIWLPPRWYPVKRYQQYQMGYLGDEYYETDGSATPYFEDQVES